MTESLLTMQPGGKVLLLFHNHKNSCINVEEHMVVGAIQTIKPDGLNVWLMRRFVAVMREMWDQSKAKVICGW